MGMVKDGVSNIGEAVPGGYHSWVDITTLLDRQDLMKDCRAVLMQIMKKMHHVRAERKY